MLQCIDIISLNLFNSTPGFAEIKNELLSSLKVDNVIYFGELPDNDSDGQDELLSNSTYFRIIFDNTNEVELEKIIEYLSSYFSSNEPKEIVLRTDSGKMKKDSYIEVYI